VLDRSRSLRSPSPSSVFRRAIVEGNVPTLDRRRESGGENLAELSSSSPQISSASVMPLRLTPRVALSTLSYLDVGVIGDPIPNKGWRSALITASSSADSLLSYSSSSLVSSMNPNPGARALCATEA
jgi:hypothetical protein